MERASSDAERNGPTEAEREELRSGIVTTPTATIVSVTATLQQLTEEAVNGYGCLGAMAVTLEADRALWLRATAGIFATEPLARMVERSAYGFSGPRPIATMDDSRYEYHLGVRALRRPLQPGRRGALIGRLEDLFRRMADPQMIEAIADKLRVAEIAALPFGVDGEPAGCIFVAAKTRFSPTELDLLAGLGQRATIAVQDRRFARELNALEQVVLGLQASNVDEEGVLQTVVRALVDRLDYKGALLLTAEDSDSLILRAYALAMPAEPASHLGPRLKERLDSHQAFVHVERDSDRENLAALALSTNRGGEYLPLSSELLYDALRPVLNVRLATMIQRSANIFRVVAVPFALEDEVQGCLVVFSHRSSFSDRELRLLQSLAQQAALGVRNARLYWRVEEQRRVAQTFARMAFSASAYLHTLRNHIGAFRTYLGLVQLLPRLDRERQNEIVNSGGKAFKALDEAAEILDHLHEPWRQHRDVPTSVNDCLAMALLKVFPRLNLRQQPAQVVTVDGITIDWAPELDLPLIYTSPDMLTEAFRIILKNAAEALKEQAGGQTPGAIWVSSRAPDKSVIEVKIRDNGVGISPANIKRIFELGWSTKKGEGMGFGLFWARNYVEGLGGRIDVESTPQKGATFRISLPAVTLD